MNFLSNTNSIVKEYDNESDIKISGNFSFEMPPSRRIDDIYLHPDRNRELTCSMIPSSMDLKLQSLDSPEHEKTVHGGNLWEEFQEKCDLGFVGDPIPDKYTHVYAVVHETAIPERWEFQQEVKEPDTKEYTVTLEDGSSYTFQA